MASTIHVCSALLLAILSGGASAASVKRTQTDSAAESLPLLRNVQTELTRLGCNISLVPLSESTADHIYAEPPQGFDGADPLMKRLQNRAEWQRDAGFIHRLDHRGSTLGFREKRSPSLHISVYPRNGSYIYEIHYDRFLALGRSPISSLKHIFGEVIPSRFFGAHTSQQHIGMLIHKMPRGGHHSSFGGE